MAVLFQNILVAAYGLVRRSGVLETGPGWRAYAGAYRAYKRLLDRDLLALKAFVDPGSLVFDVGANVGSSTLLLAAWAGAEGEVIAIEPEPRNAAELRRVALASRRRITVLEAAAADMEGTLNLAVNPDNPADHRLSGSGLAIRAVTLDALVAERPDRRVSVIKIDVQGAEPQVIAGALGTISRDRPAILMELFGEGLAAFGQTPAGMIDLMAGLGYAPHLIENGTGRPAGSEEIAGICLKHGYTDALFLPRPGGPAAMPDDARGQPL